MAALNLDIVPERLRRIKLWDDFQKKGFRLEKTGTVYTLKDWLMKEGGYMVVRDWESSAKIWVYKRKEPIKIYDGVLMVESGVMMWATCNERGGSNMSKDAGSCKESGICRDSAGCRDVPPSTDDGKFPGMHRNTRLTRADTDLVLDIDSEEMSN